MQGKVMARIVDNSESRKSHEEKKYLVCIEETSGEKDWAILIGRTATYEYIKDIIELINFEESFVLVETLKLSERKSLYAFMKFAGNFYDDGFDVEDYVKGDFDEDEFMANSNQEERSEIMDAIEDNNDRLSMQQFMDGAIKSTSLT